MSGSPARTATAGELFERRVLPLYHLADDVGAITAACHATAVRFRGGGALVAFGNGAASLDHLATGRDMALGISPDGNCGSVFRSLATARELGMLTIALVGGDGGDGGFIATLGAADHVLVARSDDPRVIKEVHVTLYHVLWELVHVFFEHPGLLVPEVIS
ncbi:MAG TPA: phosphoheptose isomerase [Pseudonocardiaceae bacterium]